MTMTQAMAEKNKLRRRQCQGLIQLLLLLAVVCLSLYGSQPLPLLMILATLAILIILEYKSYRNYLACMSQWPQDKNYIGACALAQKKVHYSAIAFYAMLYVILLIGLSVDLWRHFAWWATPVFLLVFNTLLYLQMRQWQAYANWQVFLFEDGIQMLLPSANTFKKPKEPYGFIPYADIRRSQWIEHVKGHYYFEFNTGKNYAVIQMSAELKAILQERLTNI